MGLAWTKVMWDGGCRKAGNEVALIEKTGSFAE